MLENTYWPNSNELGYSCHSAAYANQPYTSTQSHPISDYDVAAAPPSGQSHHNFYTYYSATENPIAFNTNDFYSHENYQYQSMTAKTSSSATSKPSAVAKVAKKKEKLPAKPSANKKRKVEAAGSHMSYTVEAVKSNHHQSQDINASFGSNSSCSSGAEHQSGK